MIETVNSLPVNLNTLRNSKHNRYKQHLLADSGYDSNVNKKYLKENGYIHLIAPNIKNTKDKQKIKSKQLTEKEKQKYKKRLIIESFFSWIKNYPSINQNYQKTIASYNGLLMLASSILISKRI